MWQSFCACCARVNKRAIRANVHASGWRSDRVVGAREYSDPRHQPSGVRPASIERCPLAGAFEYDRVVAGVAEEQRCRQPFLDVTVESAEYDKRALGLRRGKAIGGKPAGLKGKPVVRRGRNLKMIENQVDEALACGQLARVFGEHEELGEAQIVGPFEHLMPGERLFS